MTGKDAVSASQLSQETGVLQTTLSLWLQDARSLSVMGPSQARNEAVVRRGEGADPDGNGQADRR